MVEITYHRRYHRITAKGHAKSGKRGHDLVCASVSALVLTMAGNIESLASQDNVQDPVIQLADGDAEVSCSVSHKMSNVVTLMFDTVCVGFAMLQDLYPENVKYEVFQ